MNLTRRRLFGLLGRVAGAAAAIPVIGRLVPARAAETTPAEYFPLIQDVVKRTGACMTFGEPNDAASRLFNKHLKEEFDKGLPDGWRL